MNIAEAIGWTGAILYIIAYFLLSIGWIKAETTFYHLLNILGAIGLIINAHYLDDFPNIIVNLVWLGIGVLAIFMLIKKNQTLEKQ
ncbi:CBU_0592 family membrane protein [Sinomicrobium oceani]|uniref:CBU_0592 family membrane protein n=1 Tax=Sinomicrobium oceani TaxID=1150368 RepID=UPI00227A7F2F|nr:hypothetical protein [Sinomicrobium oceani]